MSAVATMDLRDAITMHQLTLQAEGRSEHTQRQYLHYQNLFLEWLGLRRATPTLDELNATNLREFLVWYRDRPAHPRRTRGGEVAVRAARDILKRLGQVLEDNEVVAENPLRKVKRPKITRFSRVPFTAQELNAMWGACMRTQHPTRDEALFLFLADTGARIGELCALRLDCLDLELRQARLLGKGRRERLVPLGDGSKRGGGRLVEALRRYLQTRPEPRGNGMPYVFLGRDRQRLTAAGGNDVVKRVATLAGVEGAFPHRFRHTYATWWLVNYPGDELGLRRVLGHISQAVLADYVHLSQGVIADRAGRASLVETLAAPTPPQSKTPGSPWAPVLPRPPAAVISPRIDKAALVEAVQSDPELRRALLQALLGAA